MNEAIQIAQQKADKSAEQNRNQYNRKAHGNDIVIGDRIILGNFSEKGGAGKLRAHWVNAIYVVVGKEDAYQSIISNQKIVKVPVQQKSIATSLCLVIFCQPPLKLETTKFITKFHKIKACSQIQM